MSRNRAGKRMKKLQEIEEFCEREYDEKIELAKIKKSSKVLCEACGAEANLLMDFGTYKIYLCSHPNCTHRSRK